MTRKKRSDRNHVIYQLTVPGHGTYIGVTVKDTASAQKSALRRFAKHWYRLKDPAKNQWLLYRALAHVARDSVLVEVLAQIRGKTAAHELEVRLRRQLKPNLNTDTRGDSRG